MKEFKEPKEELIYSSFGTKLQNKTRQKVLFACNFSIKIMRQHKTTKEIGLFFGLGEPYIEIIQKMQEGLTSLVKEMPELFHTPEDDIITNNEFDKLKNTSLYRRLKK